MALGNGERYYSPNYARFIQQDSFAGVPQSLNRFAYAHNNPTKHTDPSGNIVPLLLWGAAAIVVAAVSTGTVERHAAHNLEGDEKGWAKDDARRNWGVAFSDATGATKVFNAVTGTDAYTGRNLNWKERAWQGTIGAIEVIGNATAVSGVIFKAGGLVVNAARGGDDLLNLGRGAWNSIKTGQPAIKDAKAVVDAVRHPFQTAKAGWQGAKTAYQSTKTAVTKAFEGGTKQTASRVWEFTKQRLNPKNYELDGWNVNFSKADDIARFTDDVGRSVDDFMGAARQRMNETRPRYGFTEASDNVVGMADDGVKPVDSFKRPAIREYEISTLGDFQARSVVGDQLEGHEILQHSLLKRESLATTRLSTQASRQNPVIAVKRNPTHLAINRAQARLNVGEQSALENIASNARILREVGIPRRAIQKLTNKAVSHARQLGLIE